MKLHPSIQTKETTRLFCQKYKYKIVLKTRAAGWFRGNSLDNVKVQLADPKIMGKMLSAIEQNYVLKLCLELKKLSDYILRVESPLISVYTNNLTIVERLAKVSHENVKYVSAPLSGSENLLEEKKIIVKRLDYLFKVTMGRTRQSYTDFLTWCEGKDKVRLPKRAKLQLAKEHSWGGYYFYVKDEKCLTMVKMFVGGDIQTVESVVKS